jgi:hypothetical protein
MRTPRRRGCISQLFLLVIICLGVVYAVAAITSPWAFHIGGVPTPLLYWSGTGTLHAKSGTYPLYVLLYPGANFSRLRLDGLRPTAGVQGTASLCTSRGVIQPLKVSGTMYNGWSSTDDGLISVRLLERKYFDVGQRQGYFDLYGRWRGQQLVLDDRGAWSTAYRSGVRIEHASVTLERSSYSGFESDCNSLSR